MQWIKQRNTHGESSSCKPVEKKKKEKNAYIDIRREKKKQ